MINPIFLIYMEIYVIDKKGEIITIQILRRKGLQK